MMSLLGPVILTMNEGELARLVRTGLYFRTDWWITMQRCVSRDMFQLYKSIDSALGSGHEIVSKGQDKHLGGVRPTLVSFLGPVW